MKKGVSTNKQADASLPNKCEEVEGEEFGGGRDFGGGAKISALSLNRGGSQEGSDVSVHLYKCI